MDFLPLYLDFKINVGKDKIFSEYDHLFFSSANVFSKVNGLYFNSFREYSKLNPVFGGRFAA
jgi:hypothetical protein